MSGLGVVGYVFLRFVHGGLGHPDNRSKWDSSATGIPGINHKPKDSKQSSCVLVALLSVVPVWYQSLSFLWLGHFGLGIWPGKLVRRDCTGQVTFSITTRRESKQKPLFGACPRGNNLMIWQANPATPSIHPFIGLSVHWIRHDPSIYPRQ